MVRLFMAAGVLGNAVGTAWTSDLVAAAGTRWFVVCAHKYNAAFGVFFRFQIVDFDLFFGLLSLLHFSCLSLGCLFSVLCR